MNLKIVLSVAVFAVFVISCASSPKTAEQVAATGAGRIKIEKDECQVKGEGAVNRAFGNSSGINQSLTLDRALLDARTRLATQFGTMINGLLDNFDKEYAKKNPGQAGAGFYEGTTNRIQTGYVEKFLANSKTICENTYAETNGNYTVYVTVEAGEQDAGALYDQLTQDDKMSIEYDRAKFMEDFQKAKADFHQKGR